MSYSVRLRGIKCPCCGATAEPESLSPTGNLHQIFDLALTGEPLPTPCNRPAGLHILAGKKAADTIQLLLVALGRFKVPEFQEAFRKLEEEGGNGWGTSLGASYVLAKLVSMATDYPNNVWEVD